MTHAEIDALPAGREMDALVAEKVMGRKAYYHAGQRYGCLCPLDGDDDISLCKGGLSVCIAAAWEVVEWFIKYIKAGRAAHPAHVGPDEVILRIDPKRRVHRFGGRTDDPEYGYMEWTSAADTAPLAICRAALKAVLS